MSNIYIRRLRLLVIYFFLGVESFVAQKNCVVRGILFFLHIYIYIFLNVFFLHICNIYNLTSNRKISFRNVAFKFTTTYH